ncbi:UNVERIFIED_ORG: hypothetical protein J2W87_005504 [Pseudomonas putida]|nr:hypothetical protein [Pseudomonas putida]
MSRPIHNLKYIDGKDMTMQLPLVIYTHHYLHHTPPILG